MSQSFEKLSERGILPALAPGESINFSPSLRDNSGNFLPIHFAASVRGIQPVIINASVPTASAQVTFVNLSDNAIAAGSPYVVESTHSIQIDPLLTTDRTALIPVSASADLCQGSAFARANDVGAFAAGAAIPLVNIFPSGSIGTNMAIVAGRLQLPQATIARSWRLQGHIYIQANAGAPEPDLEVALRQNPDGGVFAVVLQRASSTLLASGFAVYSFDVQIDLPANPTDAQRTVGYDLITAANPATVGNNPNGITLTASSL